MPVKYQSAILNWSAGLHEPTTQRANVDDKVVFVQRQFARSVNWHCAGTSTLIPHSCYRA